MAGTTRLELATSAVTVSTFNDMEEHGRHRKSLEVRHRQRYWASRCVSRKLLSTVPGQASNFRFGGDPSKIDAEARRADLSGGFDLCGRSKAVKSGVIDTKLPGGRPHLLAFTPNQRRSTLPLMI